jgi:hypothetical protein
MQRGSERPMGVSILAVLAIISGIFGILAILEGFGIRVIGLTDPAQQQVGGFGPGLGVISLGIVSFVVAIAQLAFGFGAWQLRPWAWTLGVVLQIVSIVITLVRMIGNGFSAGSLISLAISLAILFYLYQPDIRRAFGQLGTPTNVRL